MRAKKCAANAAYLKFQNRFNKTFARMAGSYKKPMNFRALARLPL
jgi:hypothetical protein